MTDDETSEESVEVTNSGLVILVMWIISWIITAGLGVYTLLNGGLQVMWGYSINRLMCILTCWSLVYTIVIILITVYDYNKHSSSEKIEKPMSKNVKTVKKYVVLSPLLVLLITSICVAYGSYRGDLISQTTEQVKILGKLPDNNPSFDRDEIIVADIKSRKSTIIEVNGNIDSYLSKGDVIDVLKKVYSKSNQLSEYFTVVELDEQGRPIYDINNAKKHDIVPLKATILNKKEKEHYSTDDHGITRSSYTYEITFKYTSTSNIETREIDEDSYESYYRGQEITIKEDIYTLKNDIKVIDYSL